VINYLEYDRYSHKDNIIIFHFSIGSPVTRKFMRAPDKKVIIYHNITPYYFFLDYHRVLAKDCYKGRIELKNFVEKVDLALGDSRYNEQELKEAGFARTGVLPLVMDFEKFSSKTLPVLEKLFNDGKTNILFVGRIIPNKKVEDVIKVFHLYQRHFNANSRLFIAGEYRGFERYFAALQNLAQKLEIKNIHFTGHIPDDELVSYFKLSHLYLHLSEHEGFCAPIPESYFLGIPVIAYNAGAVKETMNEGGVLVNRKDYIQVAALLDEVISNTALRERIIARQRKSLQKYFKQETGRILLDYLKELS
jgi:glycosyltransferase involved in cell wall biosynthesis